MSHYEYFLKISEKIINYFIFGKEKNLHIHGNLFSKLVSIVIQVEKNIFELMKYTVVSSAEEFQKNPVISIYRRYRFIISEAYAYQSTLNDEAIYGSIEEVDVVNELGERNPQL